MQFEHVDVSGKTYEMGPIFHADEFLKPLLKLQQGIENITTDSGIMLKDVCNAPLAPQDNVCNIQNIWAYWQDDVEKFDLQRNVTEFNFIDTYLDHFLLCSK